MKKTYMFALIAIAVMIASMFAPVVLSAQPPFDSTTLYVGTIAWGPYDADPVAAYDTASGEMLFNIYETLIEMGTPVGGRNVEEQYWTFSPELATNVPDRVTVIEDFNQNAQFAWTIVVKNELPYPVPIVDPISTWWEDALPQPFNSYHITKWVDTNQNGLLDASDFVFTNDYWWAPTPEAEVVLKQVHWWHVRNVVEQGPGLIYLVLDWAPDPAVVPPECYWFTSPQHAGQVYHFEGWVDNNPDEILNFSDIIYLKKYDVVPVVWELEGPGFTYLPVTARTYHVLFATQAVPLSLHVEHFYYDFDMRTNPVINFVDNTGAVIDTFDVYDAEYSLKRGLVQDMMGGPFWMYYKPLFDQMTSDFWGARDEVTGEEIGTEADAMELSYLIKDAIEVLDSDTLRINLGIAFPDVAFKQIMAQTWGSIMSKSWSITTKGLWNGDLFTDADQNCFPDWFEAFPKGWRQVDFADDPIDTIEDVNYAGTGPYRAEVVSEATNLVRLARVPAYWGGWPAPDRKAYLEHVEIQYISVWATRREAFKAQQLDVAAIPRTYIGELLDPNDLQRMRTGWGIPFVEHPEVKTIKNISPVLSLDAIYYVFNVNPISDGIFTGVFPTGIPTNFFNNTNVRKAFATCLNRSKYLSEVYLGEALSRETVNPYGMTPDYYSYGPDPPWTYDKNLDTVKSYLQAAMFTQGAETKSVWDWGGFHLKMYYNAGNEPRRLAVQYIIDTLTELNNLYGKSFVIDSIGLTWSAILAMLRVSTAPSFTIGWLADFADPDNFVRPFMHSYGDFSYFQHYRVSEGWATPGPRTGYNKDVLIDLGIKTPDGPDREKIYKDIDDIYVADVPSIPLVQAYGRRFCQYWVKGWYYNALYPSQQYYKLYKENACWSDVTGPDPGLPDGTDNMRDIGYIAGKFGATAPDPAKTPAYNAKWTPGVYGSLGSDVFGDRKVDMRDIGYAAAHFGHSNRP